MQLFKEKFQVGLVVLLQVETTLVNKPKTV